MTASQNGRDNWSTTSPRSRTDTAQFRKSQESESGSTRKFSTSTRSRAKNTSTLQSLSGSSRTPGRTEGSVGFQHEQHASPHRDPRRQEQHQISTDWGARSYSITSTTPGPRDRCMRNRYGSEPGLLRRGPSRIQLSRNRARVSLDSREYSQE